MSETISDDSDDDSETVNGIRVTSNDARLNPNREAAEQAAAAYDAAPSAVDRIAAGIRDGQAVVWLDMHNVESNTATQLSECVPAGYEISETQIIGPYRGEDPATSLAVTVERPDSNTETSNE